MAAKMSVRGTIRVLHTSIFPPGGSESLIPCGQTSTTGVPEPRIKGATMDETANTQGFGRFTKHIILGALFGGVLSGIPILNCLNCLFCLLNIAGIVIALSMYLKEHPQDMISGAEAAGFGAAAGAGAGLISSILGLVANMFLGTFIASLMSNIPGADRNMMASTAVGAFMIPVNIILFAAFGALGGFLGMQLFFKNNLRRG